MKDLGLKIHGSNLCNEIHLPTDDETDAICCVSSLNAEYYRDWTEQFVRDIVRLLDNVLDSFIDCDLPELGKAVKGIIRDRPLGIGAIGLGTLFQKERMPFESERAKKLNEEIFKTLKQYAEKETLLLGKERGECYSMKNTGKRNSHLLAVTPTSNSSIIANCSSSIEPVIANAYTPKSRAGTFFVKNKYVEEELETLNMNDKKTWSSIINNKGSVSHLDISDELKKIFKTATEIDQLKIIEYAADRQKYICQGQSLNLFIKPPAAKKDIHTFIFELGNLVVKDCIIIEDIPTSRSKTFPRNVLSA